MYIRKEALRPFRSHPSKLLCKNNFIVLYSQIHVLTEVVTKESLDLFFLNERLKGLYKTYRVLFFKFLVSTSYTAIIILLTMFYGINQGLFVKSSDNEPRDSGYKLDGVLTM